MVAIDAPAIVRLMDCAGVELASRYLEPIREAMQRADISTPLRAAHFFAQIGHECGGLRWPEEIADGGAYEGRADLGNNTPGDGKRFKGRGLIQLTGRRNYAAFAAYCGVDVVANPALVSQPQLGALAAAWFWSARKLNVLADGDSGSYSEVQIKGRKIAINSAALRITKIINGGTNGIEDRQRRLAANKKFLGIT